MKPQSRNKPTHTSSPPAAPTTSKDYFSHIPEQRTLSPTTSHNNQPDHFVERPYLRTTTSTSSSHSSTWLQRTISQNWLSDRPLSDESRSALKDYEELFRPALENRRDRHRDRDGACDRDRHSWGQTP
ncbi:hypothetical protein P168DRAFT_287035 [Aspergillus campestris IBT 28561]|uniref:Uncharacterized protein n=1 Tax=Aspergillus campestris (strain IBT 28561) TaxID=1392248 RepID=A0A2I1DGG4_ASPC2|nr:uncharacterized protein P168DRAFT_287035 [Aspergillus campestris IBT 28561]PKY08962.1 hypothetical protein P168DRAFT_287035 [Aspergillus campestris IBT 28561]